MSVIFGPLSCSARLLEFSIDDGIVPRGYFLVGRVLAIPEMVGRIGIPVLSV